MARRTRAKIAAKKRTQASTSLAMMAKEGGKHLASATLKTPEISELGLLRQIYRLARGSDFTGQERSDLVSDITKRIDQYIQSGSGLRLKNFGVRNATELAELFVKELEDMNIRPKTFRAFTAHMRLAGYQSRVRGRLFHLYVRNLAALQDDLLKWALDQVDELNGLRISGAPGKPILESIRLVNALGQMVTVEKRFTKAPFKVDKVEIIKADGKRVEFIDDALVSFSGTGKNRFMSFLTETEVKTAAAAKGLSEQIASAQIRTGSVDTVSIRVTGRQSVMKNGRYVFEETPTTIDVEPQRIVYSPRSINRSGITLFSASRWARIKDKGLVDAGKIYKASEFKLRSTAKGMGETYLFIRLAINTDEFNKLVHAILPGSPKN